MRRSEQRREAVFFCYQRDQAKRPQEEPADEAVVDKALKTDFSRDLVNGVTAHMQELDDIIASHAVGWSIDRIAPLEKCIMRIALYEILYRDDVPTEVAINEAVELAKRYCGIDSPSFINGILGSALREISESG